MILQTKSHQNKNFYHYYNINFNIIMNNMVILVFVATTLFTIITCQDIIRVYVDMEETIEDYDSASTEIVKDR